MNSSINVRNFCIIAHVDHGKSTLADRMLQITGTVPNHKMREQFLDKIKLERERGITIKLQAVRMRYVPERLEIKNLDLEIPDSGFILNLVDTPGHIDFSYEVSRALAACEGAVLLVDATQGIQAQTLANYEKAVEAKLTIIPVVNKIDLTEANPKQVVTDIVETFGFNENEILYTSGKTGYAVTKLLHSIVRRVPPPQGDPDALLRALIFDSFYDEHLGVIALVRVVDGKIKRGERLQLIHSQTDFDPVEIGYITAEMTPADRITIGEIGYIATGLKSISRVRVGDTVTTTVASLPAIPIAHNNAQHLTSEVKCAFAGPLPGYKEPTPMVFANLFPESSSDLKNLREAIQKYHLTDAAFTYQPTNSLALGMGFRCGFLGLLHLDVVRERLEDEFNVFTLLSSPGVEYLVETQSNETICVRSPEELLEPSRIKLVKEPWAKVEIYGTNTYLGGLMKICEDHRGQFANLIYLSGDRVKLVYAMPLNEIIQDFFDQVKSVSSGYASLDYWITEYRKVDLVRLDVLLNKEKYGALSRLVVRDQARELGLKLVEKLKKELPRQQFSVPIQAAVGGKIMARADLPASRKDVTAKLYGGDRTRKDKLLKKQAAGKKRLQEQGSISVPGDVYQKILTV